MVAGEFVEFMDDLQDVKSFVEVAVLFQERILGATVEIKVRQGRGIRFRSKDCYVIVRLESNVERTEDLVESELGVGFLGFGVAGDSECPTEAAGKDESLRRAKREFHGAVSTHGKARDGAVL